MAQKMANVSTSDHVVAAHQAVPAILVADGLVMRFATAEGEITAIDDVSFDVAPGEFLAVIGPSGCGKSTLFNIIGGLLGGYRGRVAVGGETISGPHASIGMVFQEESTFPWRNVVDNVAFPLEIAGVPRRERLERARRFVSMVGLDGFEKRYPSELSGGMRQRVSMARTLASEPKILLMDEPFAALDEQTRLVLGEDLSVLLARTGKTIVFVTHSLSEAVLLADRIVVMTARPGKIKSIIAVGEPHPRSPDFMLQPHFSEIRNQCYELLRDEIRSTVDAMREARDAHTG